jgi:hypothetical protein
MWNLVYAPVDAEERVRYSVELYVSRQIGRPYSRNKVASSLMDSISLELFIGQASTLRRPTHHQSWMGRLRAALSPRNPSGYSKVT